MDREALTAVLERTVMIHARPETVFRYFQDTARWASWWGAGSTIDPRPGGKVLIVYPGNVEATGDVLEITPPTSIVFTYGYSSGTPIGPGQSIVTIHFEPVGRGTLVCLSHAFRDSGVRDQHVQGWRYQLSLFANVVSNDLNGDVSVLADAWFDAWAEPDEAKRRVAISAIAAPDVTFGDRYSRLTGIDDLVYHAGAAQKFMPGMRLERSGPARHCLGTALVDWHVKGSDGSIKASGTNVFQLDQDGRIAAITGLWN